MPERRNFKRGRVFGMRPVESRFVKSFSSSCSSPPFQSFQDDDENEDEKDSLRLNVQAHSIADLFWTEPVPASFSRSAAPGLRRCPGFRRKMISSAHAPPR